MRRLVLMVLTAAMVATMAGTAWGHPTVALDPTLPTDVTFAATDNIDYLGRFPEHIGTAGGLRIDDVYYVTDPRGIFTYDVSDPANPVRLGSLQRFQTTTGAALSQEDPNTDGHILLVDGSSNPFTGAALTIVDVSDPTNLSVLSTIGVTDHTWTCVTGLNAEGELRGCAYAFGRTGHIIDLTNPAAPAELGVTWRQMVGYGATSNSPYAHDLTEIKPGLVMSAGRDAILMDTSQALHGHLLAADGTAIRKIAAIDDQAARWSTFGYHSVEWKVQDDGRLDPFLIAGTELAPRGTFNSAGSDCDDDQSVIDSYDATAVVAAIEAYESGDVPFNQAVAGVRFERLDSFDAAGRGAYVDGNAPAHVLYCAHWMELHPDFDGGGFLAVSYYDRGTRFVELQADGTFADEAAWIVPLQGYSGSAQWVTGEIVYIHDYTRGLELIRLNGDATGTYTSATSPQAVTSNFTPASDFHPENMATAALLLLGFAMSAVELRRRRTVRVEA